MLTGRGTTARGRLDSGCPGGNSYKAKMFGPIALGPSRTNKVLFERTLFVAAVRRSLLCLDSPQVKFSAERVASGRPRLRGSQRQKSWKNESAGSWDSRCAGVFCGCIFVLPPRCQFRAFAPCWRALRREVPGRLISSDHAGKEDLVQRAQPEELKFGLRICPSFRICLSFFQEDFLLPAIRSVGRGHKKAPSREGAVGAKQRRLSYEREARVAAPPGTAGPGSWEAPLPEEVSSEESAEPEDSSEAGSEFSSELSLSSWLKRS